MGTEDKGGCGKEEDKNSIQVVNWELNTLKWNDQYMLAVIESLIRNIWNCWSEIHFILILKNINETRLYSQLICLCYSEESLLTTGEKKDLVHTLPQHQRGNCYNRNGTKIQRAQLCVSLKRQLFYVTCQPGKAGLCRRATKSTTQVKKNTLTDLPEALRRAKY